ncbi:MAG: alpha/beta fold hydrolase [Proteobacteria bacterium]|nr:alpha/beta fold hydrolase [Pseudomonadota bacterium]
MKNFVLLHGAWHGGWVWDEVRGSLEQAGHRVEAPTLPGHGPDDDRAGFAFAHYEDALVEVVVRQPGPVVLVGHSSAGIIMQAAAPRVADRLEHLVFLSAFLLGDGQCQLDLVPPEAAERMSLAAADSPDNCVPVMPPFVRNVLMAGASPAQQDAVLQSLVPQPLALFTHRISLEPFAALDVPRTVIIGEADTSLPPGTWEAMARANCPHLELIRIRSGHESPVLDPVDVVRGLLAAVGEASVF